MSELEVVGVMRVRQAVRPPESSATEGFATTSSNKSTIAAKQADPQSDTSKLDAEIDSIVYKLYGLTDDEIAVVEKVVKK